MFGPCARAFVVATLLLASLHSLTPIVRADEPPARPTGVRAVAVDDLPNGVWKVAWSPDGRFAAGVGIAERLHEERNLWERWAILLWDADDFKQLGRWEVEMYQVTDVAFTPDGTRLLVHEAVGRLVVVDTERRRLLHEIRTRDTGEWSGTMAISPDGSQVALSEYRMPVRFYDVETGRLLRKERIGGHFGASTLLWLADGRLLHSEAHAARRRPIERRFVFRDATDFRVQRSIPNVETPTLECGTVNDEELLVGFQRSVRGSSKVRPGEVVLTDLETMQEVVRFRHDGFWAPSFSPDGRWMLLVDVHFEDKRVACYDLDAGRLAWEWKPETSRIHQGAFSPPGGANSSGPDPPRLLLAGEPPLLVELDAVDELAGGEPLTPAAALQALAGGDTIETFLALERLRRGGPEAARLLAGHAPRDTPIDKLVEKLGDARFAVREKATHELAALVDGRRDEFRSAYRHSESLEVRRRLRRILGEEEAAILAGTDPGDRLERRLRYLRTRLKPL